MKKANIVPNEELKIIKNKSEKKEVNLDVKKLTSAVSFSSDVNNLNNDIFTLFPNIQLAIEIMTSSILSPNTMTGEEYNLTINNKILPLDIVGTISNVIKDHIDTNYNFKDRLYNIIEETIYTKGSYCELILPPNLITDLYKTINKRQKRISAGIEDFMDSFNNFTPTSLIDTRRLNNEMRALDAGNEYSKYITVSENYSYFLKDKIIDKAVDNTYKYEIGAGLEDTTVLDSVMMLDDSYEIENDFKVAFTKKLPNESVLPISDKDDPKKHYGYFVFLNNTGTPIEVPETNIPENHNLINFGLSGDNKKVGEGEKLIKKAKDSLGNMTRQAPEIPGRSELVEMLINKKIETTLKNSVIKDVVNYDIELKREVTETIWKKIENHEKVNILFVPNKYLNYYATAYRSNGTGKSLLEEVLLLVSIKAMLFLARITSYIRGSIITTDIQIELDEDDQDPDRTLAKVLNYIKRGRQMQLPMGMMKVNDLVDWIHNVGFKVTAEHPKLPKFALSVDENTLPVNTPDSDLEEMIEKNINLTLGTTPEMIDNSYSADFATTIVANNILMTRRVYMKQKLLNPQLTSNIVKYIQSDPMLYNKIKSIIEENIPAIKRKINKLATNNELKSTFKKANKKVLSAWIFKEVLKSISVSLPKPELQDDDPNAELFSKLSDKLDDVLDVILSDDLFDSDLLGDLADKVESQKKVLKGLVMYKWMSQNRFMPEVTDIFSVDEDGNPLLNLSDEYKTLVEALKTNIVPLLKEMNKFKKKSDEQLEKIEDDGDGDTDTDDDTGDDDETSTDETTDDSTDTGDTDDFGSDDDGDSTDDDSGSDETSTDDSENKDDDSTGEEDTGDDDGHGDSLTSGLF